MSKYAIFHITVPIATDSEMYLRLEQMAKNKNCTIEAMVDSVAQLGIYGHIEGNLPTYEKIYGK